MMWYARGHLIDHSFVRKVWAIGFKPLEEAKTTMRDSPTGSVFSVSRC
jgi:hypothetical protein